jgi:hypothetical protein
MMQKAAIGARQEPEDPSDVLRYGIQQVGKGARYVRNMRA